MQYMGGKCRIASKIIPIMESARGSMPWVEPFVGGANVICRVAGERHGFDTHYYLIKLLQQMAKPGFVAPIITEADYRDIKASPDEYSDWLVGFAGFFLSFGGKWWGGYSKNKAGRDYAAAAKRIAEKQAAQLDGCKFTQSNYKDLLLTEPCLVYCDPPYQGTTGYSTGEFDHGSFWGWCRKMAGEGHLVYVSEYTGPAFAKEVWSGQARSTLNKNAGDGRVEKLFTLEA